MADYWEIGFKLPEGDLYFAGPEADFAKYVRSDLPVERITNTTWSDVVLVRSGSDGDYAIAEGAYTGFVSFEWPDGRKGPSVVHGLERVGKFGNLIVSTRIVAFVLFYYEGIAASRLHYFEGQGLACLADHLKELEDQFLNEHDHPTRQAADLFRASVRQDEILQNEQLAELAKIYAEEEQELEDFDEFEDLEEYGDDFDDDVEDSVVQDDSEEDFIYQVVARRP